MYFGNEITSSSDRLSYCLFECGWIDQLQSSKKCILLFGKQLHNPHQLIVLKIYSITLETFTRVCEMFVTRQTVKWSNNLISDFKIGLQHVQYIAKF